SHISARGDTSAKSASARRTQNETMLGLSLGGVWGDAQWAPGRPKNLRFPAALAAKPPAQPEKRNIWRDEVPPNLPKAKVLDVCWRDEVPPNLPKAKVLDVCCCRARDGARGWRKGAPGSLF